MTPFLRAAGGSVHLQQLRLRFAPACNARCAHQQWATTVRTFRPASAPTGQHALVLGRRTPLALVERGIVHPTEVVHIDECSGDTDN